MRWAGWAKSRGPPSAGTPEFQAKIFFKIIFPLQWKLEYLEFLGKPQVRNHNPHQICLSFIFQLFKKPTKYKNDSQTAKSHLMYQNFSLILFLSPCQCKNCKKLLRQLPQWIRTYPLSKPNFLNLWLAMNNVNFWQTLQRDAFWRA